MNIKIAVIGLGYVGLPLARLFSTKYKTIGFDLNTERCEALMDGHDATLEVSDSLLQDAINNHGFVCTSDIEKIKDCNFYVVAVPTPVDENNHPDLRPLWGASETVGKVISKSKQNLIFESNYTGYIIHVSNVDKFETDKFQKIFIYEHKNEYSHSYFGFKEFKERILFEDLISIPGIGPKTALSILTIS